MAYSRNEYMQGLRYLPQEMIRDAARQVRASFVVENKSLPEAGLALLKMEDGAWGDHFYLGEFPVASAHVLLRTEQGHEYEGGANVMSDHQDYASDLAVCDAVLHNRLQGWQELEKKVEQGLNICKQINRQRRAMLLKTKVDFSLLADASGGSHED